MGCLGRCRAPDGVRAGATTCGLAVPEGEGSLVPAVAAAAALRWGWDKGSARGGKAPGGNGPEGQESSDGEQNSVRNGPLEEKCVPASGQGQSEVARASRRGLVPRKDDAQGVIQGSRGGRGLCRGLGLLSRAAELC